MAFDVKYLGHSGFEITVRDKIILIDPFLSINPNYDPLGLNISDIFVTHGHDDHLGNSIDIAKNTRAKITAIFELANYCGQKGTRTNGVNFGSWLNYPWGRAMFLPAVHTSSTSGEIYTGAPASILFEFGEMRIFHAGDTALHSELKLYQELYHPDIVMLPIGGTYTMGPEEALIAVSWLKPKVVIPIHYNTFSQIKVDVDKFKMDVEHKNILCEVMKPNEILSY